jgi:hypothetical protein
VHACEADFGAETDVFPYFVFCGYKVGEAFADEGEAGEGGHVHNGRLEKDVD